MKREEGICLSLHGRTEDWLEFLAWVSQFDSAPPIVLHMESGVSGLIGRRFLQHDIAKSKPERMTEEGGKP